MQAADPSNVGRIHRRRWRGGVVAGGMVWLALAVAAWWMRQPLLTAVGAYLVVDEPRDRAEAIVVVSGSVPDRMLEAVELYRGGLAPAIVLTREDEAPGVAAARARGVEVPDRHDVNVSVATQFGVPASAIVTAPGHATSTRSEAEIAVAFLRHAGIHRVLLVTSKLHARRAGMIFRSVAGNSVQFTVCASPFDTYDPATWWHHRAFVRRVIFEYQKLLLWKVWEQWRVAP
ncbi:MAG: YdcF family protein [Deltaproteobacteria bacterium]|nr:YdcF family protein [Deltaproteobacteria bacterium]MBI3388420.1 YdcF family protein [Deltaproteobacteria bacterium]